MPDVFFHCYEAFHDKKDVCAAGALTVTALLALSAAQAAAITGNIGAAGAITAYKTYDISTGTSDWAAFGGLGQGGTAADFTYKQSAAANSFGAVTVLQGTGYTTVINGPIKFAYGAAGGTYATATGVASVDVNPAVADRGSGLSQLSFTHTMLAASEDLQVFVVTKNYADNAVDVLVTIPGSASYSQTLTMPDALDGSPPYAPMGDFFKGSFGIVTLNVAGASVGDTLTFTLTGNYAGKTPAGWWGVGIAGATATAVPEPAFIGVLGIGVACWRVEDAGIA